jgi:hypothetical protein
MRGWINSRLALETEQLFLLQLADETYSTLQNVNLFKDEKLILEGVLYFYFSIQRRSDSCQIGSYGSPRPFLVYRQLWERIGH